jgi:hypothetical protein
VPRPPGVVPYNHEFVDWSFVRREWGAVTFVLTVLVGIIVVPTALYFGHQSAASNAATPTIASTARTTIASTARP